MRVHPLLPAALLALVAGVGRYHDRPIAVIGHQKGRDTPERTARNFGMAGPEGYS